MPPAGMSKYALFAFRFDADMRDLQTELLADFDCLAAAEQVVVDVQIEQAFAPLAERHQTARYDGCELSQLDFFCAIFILNNLNKASACGSSNGQTTNYQHNRSCSYKHRNGYHCYHAGRKSGYTGYKSHITSLFFYFHEIPHL